MSVIREQAQRNLFYVYTPRWIETSAGIKVLHQLCSLLNEIGQEAYLVFSEESLNNSPRINGELFTPILTKELFLAHKLSHREPIVIYSETIVGNPLNAKYVIRYLLNYVELLGGPSKFDCNTFFISYTKDIAHDYREKSFQESEVFFLPSIEVKKIPFNEKKEDFWLLYRGKINDYSVSKNYIDIKFLESTLNSKVEIVARSGKKYIERRELLDKLSKAKGVILFENSAIIMESLLSGGIAILLPSNLSRPIIGKEEFGLNGISLSLDLEEIERAESTKHLARSQYLALYENTDERLINLILKIEAFFSKMHPKDIGELRLPKNVKFINGGRILLSFKILRKNGLRAFLKLIISFMYRRLRFFLHQGK